MCVYIIYIEFISWTNFIVCILLFTNESIFICVFFFLTIHGSIIRILHRPLSLRWMHFSVHVDNVFVRVFTLRDLLYIENLPLSDSLNNLQPSFLIWTSYLEHARGTSLSTFVYFVSKCLCYILTSEYLHLFIVIQNFCVQVLLQVVYVDGCTGRRWVLWAIGWSSYSDSSCLSTVTCVIHFFKYINHVKNLHKETYSGAKFSYTCHGSHSSVCITICLVRHGDSVTKPNYYYYLGQQIVCKRSNLTC